MKQTFDAKANFVQIIDHDDAGTSVLQRMEVTYMKGEDWPFQFEVKSSNRMQVVSVENCKLLAAWISKMIDANK